MSFFAGFANELTKLANNPLGIRNPNFNPFQPRGGGSAKQAKPTAAPPSPSPGSGPRNPGLRSQMGFQRKLNQARSNMMGSKPQAPAPAPAPAAPKPAQSVQQASGGTPATPKPPTAMAAAPKPKMNMGTPSMALPKKGKGWGAMSGSERGSAMNKLF